MQKLTKFLYLKSKHEFNTKIKEINVMIFNIIIKQTEYTRITMILMTQIIERIAEQEWEFPMTS